MRLWSLHPQYLDRQGLLALWREALLAQKVLAGATRGYRHHPQLLRFREANDPLAAIGYYLSAVAEEGKRRGYRFDESKILRGAGRSLPIPVSQGQLQFERGHLTKKLRARDLSRYRSLVGTNRLRVHPCFCRARGPVADWEKGVLSVA